jgi:hypothetical protein
MLGVWRPASSIRARQLLSLRRNNREDSF